MKRILFFVLMSYAFAASAQKTGDVIGKRIIGNELILNGVKFNGTPGSGLATVGGKVSLGGRLTEASTRIFDSTGTKVIEIVNKGGYSSAVHKDFGGYMSIGPYTAMYGAAFRDQYIAENFLGLRTMPLFKSWDIGVNAFGIGGDSLAKLKLHGYLNNVAGDSILTTDASGNLKFILKPVGGGVTYTPGAGINLSGNVFAVKDTVEGVGNKLQWLAAKGAFRAGTITFDNSTAWNVANIGDYSAAFGYNNKASGHYTMAFGRDNNAIGGFSFAGGLLSVSSGNQSFAFGDQVTANGSSSVALNGSTTAIGINSFAANKGTIAEAAETAAFGTGTIAKKISGFVLGEWNDDMDDGTEGAYARIFQIGNGTGIFNRRNAMTVLKNGRMQFNNYGSGGITGTGAYALHVDAAGNIVEGAIPNLSGYQTLLTNPVTGTVLSGYLSVMSGGGTLTSSVIRESGGNIAIGAAPSTQKLYLNGTSYFTGNMQATLIHFGGNSGYTSFFGTGTNGAVASSNFQFRVADGAIVYRMRGDGLISWGGETALFPAIKRNATTLEAKLATDAAFTDFKAKSFIADGKTSNDILLGDGTSFSKPTLATKQDVSDSIALRDVIAPGWGNKVSSSTSLGITTISVGRDTTQKSFSEKADSIAILRESKVSFAMPFYTNSLAAPASATTYYWGGVGISSSFTTAATEKGVILPFACKLVGYSMSLRGSVAAVPTTACTFSINNITTSTDLVFNNTAYFQAPGTRALYSANNLNTNYAAGDQIQFKMLTPTWTTAPTNTEVYLTLYFQNL